MGEPRLSNVLVRRSAAHDFDQGEAGESAIDLVAPFDHGSKDCLFAKKLKSSPKSLVPRSGKDPHRPFLGTIYGGRFIAAFDGERRQLLPQSIQFADDECPPKWMVRAASTRGITKVL